MRLRSGLAAGLVAATAVAGAAAAAQRSTADRPPSLAITSLTGADTFAFYCAPCHGRDGKGNGPVAAALKTLPADLTHLTARNKGVFPKEQVRTFITNGTGDILAHGSPDMPIWGPTFRALETSDKLVNVRIFNVVSYLESIQQ
jgi:mono/diheme cytochrome c family protein